MYVLTDLKNVVNWGFASRGWKLADRFSKKINFSSPVYSAVKSSYLIVRCFKSCGVAFTKSILLVHEYKHVCSLNTCYEGRSLLQYCFEMKHKM